MNIRLFGSLGVNQTNGLLRRAVTIALVGAAAGAPAVDAYAQAANASPPTAASSARASGELEDIVVTSRRVEERLRDVPVAITAMSEENLAARQIADLVNVGAYSPGVQIVTGTASSFTAFVQSRGQTQASSVQTFEPAIGVYQNEVYAGHVTGLKGIGLLDVSRVEILKGPQGTLYGRNTTGGAFSMFTNMPTYENEGNVSATIGNLNSYGATGVINFPIVDNRLAMRIAVGAATDDGWSYDLTHQRKLQASDSTFARVTTKWDASDDVEVILLGEIARARNSGQDWHVLGLLPQSFAAYEVAVQSGVMPASAANRAAFVSGAASAKPWIAAVQSLVASRQPGVNGSRDDTRVTNINPQQYESDFLTLTVNWQSPLGTLKSLTGYRQVVDDQTAIDFDGTEYDILNGPTHSQAQVAWLATQGLSSQGVVTGFRMLSEDLNLSGGAGRVKYTAGLFYHHSDQSDYSTTSILPNVQPAGSSPSVIEFYSTSESVAAYGQTSIELASSVGLTVGARYTNEKKTVDARSRTQLACNVPPPATLANCRGNYAFDDSNVSWTAGFDWKPTDATMLYVKADRGFRSGGINGRTSADPFSVRPFNSEIVTSYEAGAKAALFQNRMTVDLAFYSSDYKDIQQSVVIAGASGSPTSVVQNAAKATIRGAELELHAQPMDALEIGATAAYLDPKYDEYRDPRTGADLTGLNFPFASEWTYSLFGQYSIPTATGSVDLQADWNYRTTRDLNPTGGQLAITVRPGYGIANAQATWRLANDFDVSLWSKNLTDKRVVAFVQAIASFGAAAGGYNPPRTYGLTVRKRFQ